MTTPFGRAGYSSPKMRFIHTPSSDLGGLPEAEMFAEVVREIVPKVGDCYLGDALKTIMDAWCDRDDGWPMNEIGPCIEWYIPFGHNGVHGVGTDMNLALTSGATWIINTVITEDEDVLVRLYRKRHTE